MQNQKIYPPVSQSNHPLMVEPIRPAKNKTLNTINNRILEYVQEIRISSPAMWHRYEGWLRLFEKYVIENTGQTMLDAVDESTCRTWMFHMLGTRRMKNNTVRGRQGTLNRFFRWCVERGYLTASPMA